MGRRCGWDGRDDRRHGRVWPSGWAGTDDGGGREGATAGGSSPPSAAGAGTVGVPRFLRCRGHRLECHWTVGGLCVSVQTKRLPQPRAPLSCPLHPMVRTGTLQQSTAISPRLPSCGTSNKDRMQQQQPRLMLQSSTREQWFVALRSGDATDTASGTRPETNSPIVAGPMLPHSSTSHTIYTQDTQSGGTIDKEKKKNVQATLLRDNSGPTPNKDTTCRRAHGPTSHLRPAFFRENCTAKYGM